MARLERHSADDLGYRHLSSRGENIGKFALMPRIKMNDNNKSGIDVIGQTFEKHLQGLDPTRGRSNADGWKSLNGFPARTFLPHIVHSISCPGEMRIAMMPLSSLPPNPPPGRWGVPAARQSLGEHVSFSLQLPVLCEKPFRYPNPLGHLQL